MTVQLVDVVGVLATMTVFIMELGPAPAVREIVKNRSTGLTPLVPLVALGTNGWIWGLYGVLGYNYFPVAVSNFMASVLSAIYTIIFYRYTTDRAYAHKVIAFFLAFDAAATGYAYLAVSYFGQPRAEVQSIMGVIGILTVFMFFASPSENIALVFRHRTGAYIPIELVTVGAINSFFWSFYALLQADWILFAPNFGALLLGVAQIALYFAFHPSKAQPKVVDPPSVEIPLANQPAGYGTVHA